LTLTGNNNVGVRTVAPAYPLDVDGNVNILGDDNTGAVAALRIESTGTGNIMLIDGNEIDTVNHKLYLNVNSAFDVLIAKGGGDVGIGTDTPNATLSVNGSQSIKRTASAVDYNPSVLTTDNLIAMTDTSVPRAAIISTEDIQKGTTANPRTWIIKDESMGAGSNSITVSGESGLIDGNATLVMNSDGQAIEIYSDGTNLWVT